MSAYFLHDGQNELGPLTIDALKEQGLSRNTPIRRKDTDKWMPAEKLQPLKEVVAPKKIKHPKDILPLLQEGFTHIQQRRPKVLYAGLLCAVLLASFSIFSGLGYKIVAEEPLARVENPQSLTGEPVEATPPPTLLSETKVQASQPTVVIGKEKSTRLQWNKLITATNSNYGIGLLGGIKDLTVIINNRTDYPIDEAVAKLTYIKANGSVWKTKLVSIYNVPAQDNKEQPVPDVGRGKKVKVSIQKIVSSKMKFNYTEGQKIKNPDDPYLIQ